MYSGINIRVSIHKGALMPREEYFSMLDALCDVHETRTAVQFTNPVGLGRVATTGFVIGALTMAHLIWLGFNFSSSTAGSTLVKAWCVYFIALCFYHLSEFATTARYNAPLVTWESFLLDQSRAYQIAMLASWLEFWIEAAIMPGFKTGMVAKFVMVLGLALVFIGQGFRTGAMVEAGSNFSHLIQVKKTKSHQLVTSGLYKYVRHPSYFGWFWWSIGTQLLMFNPICLVGYAIAAWKFFESRIPYEERKLVEFFPQEYPAYRKRTPIGIPFIPSHA